MAEIAYQVPLPGRNTAMSALPSPSKSKSTDEVRGAVKKSPKSVAVAALRRNGCSGGPTWKIVCIVRTVELWSYRMAFE